MYIHTYLKVIQTEWVTENLNCRKYKIIVCILLCIELGYILHIKAIRTAPKFLSL